MKAINTTLIFAFLIASIAVNAQNKTAAPQTKQPATQTTKPAPAKSPAADPVASEKAWKMYMEPGDMHKRLLMDEGSWHENLTFWMAPGAPPTYAESECKTNMILGGRYQESVHTGQMMGMEFEGHGLIGYDNALKMYQSTWVDNMGTGIMYLQGKYDDKTKTINYSGKSVDPETGKESNVRQVVHLIDDHNKLIEMYYTKNGKEFKNMEIKMSHM